MKRFLWFLIPSLLFFVALGVALICMPQQVLHLWLNGYHTDCLDAFFKYYTAVGDYLTFALVILLLFNSLGNSLLMLSAYCGVGLLTQIAKHILHAPRPAIVFDIANHPDALPLVEGVTLHTSNSFPSGHTTIFFALFTVLAILIIRNLRVPKYSKIPVLMLFSVLAMLGGYSRIYLSQHFAADVFAGGMIGLFSTMLIAYSFDYLRVKHPKFYSWHIILPKRKKR